MANNGDTAGNAPMPIDALRELSARYLDKWLQPAEAVRCLLSLCLMCGFGSQIERLRSESSAKTTSELEHAFLALLLDARALAADLEALVHKRESAGVAGDLDALLHKLEAVIPDLTDGESGRFSFTRYFGPDAPCDESQLHELLRNVFDIETRMDSMAPHFEQRGQQVRELLLAQVGAESRRTPAIGERQLDWPLPNGVRDLMIGLLGPVEGDSVYDPACRSGDLLIAASGRPAGDTRSVSQPPIRLYGQARTPASAAIARINLALHSNIRHDIRSGDLIRSPRFVNEAGALETFTAVASVPPLERLSGLDWGYEFAEQDLYGRFERGLPRRSHGEAAYLLHMVQSMDAIRGRMVGVFSQGVVFRSNGEKDIRRQLVEEGLVDAVIALPGKLLYETDIAVVLLVLCRPELRRSPGAVLFVDASAEFKSGHYQNELTDEHIRRILNVYYVRPDIEPGFARVAPIDKIRGNDYNLRVQRYVGTDLRPTASLEDLSVEYARLTEELRSVTSRIDERLTEIANAEPPRATLNAKTKRGKRSHKD